MAENLELDASVTGRVIPPAAELTDAKKLEMIAYVVDLQSAAQNDEADGDAYQADAYLAMEAIERILSGDPDFRRNGAVRTYLGD